MICEIIVPNYETDTDRHPFRDWALWHHHWNHNSISLSLRIDKPTVMILSPRHCRKGWWRIWWLAKNIEISAILPPYGHLLIFETPLNCSMLGIIQAVWSATSGCYLTYSKTYGVWWKNHLAPPRGQNSPYIDEFYIKSFYYFKILVIFLISISQKIW